MNVITRFPPSPTGFFHIGSARTALFNYLFASKNGGTMCLRFEDTDKERSKKEYEDDIIAGLEWLGISYTKPEIFRQSERTDVYRRHLKTLIEKGAAYEAEASTDNPDTKVVRFANPNIRITFSDLVRGEVSFDTTELKDFIIARNMHEPLYHLAVVVDDHEMGVTHVIRGEDHISNTQRQILVLEALGFPRPLYAHIPLILAPDRTKLSKRHGAVSVNEYRAEGYLPHAFRNYLGLLGWTPSSGEEILGLSEMIKQFDLKDIHKSGAIFDVEKLRWFNRQYLRRMPVGEFAKKSFEILHNSLVQKDLSWSDGIAGKLVPLIAERISVWKDLAALASGGEFDYFFFAPTPEAEKIPNKNSNAHDAAEYLTHVRDTLAVLSDEDFTETGIKNMLWNYATKVGRGAVLWPLRYALSGKERSPDPFVIASIVGKKETLERIETAIGHLQAV